MKTISFFKLFSISLLFFIVACSNAEEEALLSPILKIDTEVVNFEENKSMKEVVVSTNQEWSAQVDKGGETWCQTEKDGTTLRINVAENSGKEIRQTNITVRVGNLSQSLKIQQLGWGKDILVSPELFEIAAAGQNITFEVTANCDYEIVTTGCDWIKKPTTRAQEMITTSHAYIVSPNAQDASRSYNLVVKDQAASSTLQRIITVTQKGLNEYSSTKPDELKDDIKIKISRGEASSFQSGQNIEKSFDNDMSTIYHSSWNNAGSNYFPITLTYYFENQEQVDYLVYHPRQSGSNGHFKETEIYWSADGVAFERLMDKNFGGLSSSSVVYFTTPLINAKAIRFVVKSGAGDNQGFASCSEMEFYRKNPENFDVLSLFSDRSCSELKAGITLADIEKCQSAFFKNMAYYMFQGKYPKAFRIESYKAYPSPDIQSATNKTNPYNLLDNPTGIYVEANDELIVLAGETHGRAISIRVQNLDLPGGDGFGGDSYALKEGTNKISIRNKGLVYVMYHTLSLEESEVAQPITLHFATGKVNGYFDRSKHSASDWNELLNQTCCPYFDVLGQYTHLTFPVNSFKTYTKNGVNLIDTYDEVVRYEMEFMGLFKYNKVFKNRMYLHVMYHSYMYASPYHTAYNANTMNSICDETKLRAGEVWGPAHEIGHCNQTRPGLKWHSTTEVTNNILSMAVQTHFCDKYGSKYIRLRDENMGEYNDRYEKAMTLQFVNKQPDAIRPDVFCRLVTLWQLQLYFAQVKGQTDFYKDLYELIRTENNLATPGENQLEFTVRASKIARTDLTDFFDKWGYYLPIDRDIDDYGTKRMTITEAQIEQTKNKIKNLNLPKPDAAIEYLSEHNLACYKDKQNVQTGTASRNGQTLTMNNWNHVTAYEVYNGDQLVFVSNRHQFTISTTWEANYKVYAVSYKGDKTLVTF